MKIKLLLFSLLISQFVSSQVGDRCGANPYLSSVLKNNPGLENRMKSIEAGFSSSSFKGINKNKVIIIPVVVTILHKGEREGVGRNVSNSKVLEQIRILNEVYSNSNKKGVDTRIRFCLAKRDDLGRSTTGIHRYYASQDSYQPFDSDNKVRDDDPALRSF